MPTGNVYNGAGVYAQNHNPKNNEKKRERGCQQCGYELGRGFLPPDSANPVVRTCPTCTTFRNACEELKKPRRRKQKKRKSTHHDNEKSAVEPIHHDFVMVRDFYLTQDLNDGELVAMAIHETCAHTKSGSWVTAGKIAQTLYSPWARSEARLLGPNLRPYRSEVIRRLLSSLAKKGFLKLDKMLDKRPAATRRKGGYPLAMHASVWTPQQEAYHQSRSGRPSGLTVGAKFSPSVFKGWQWPGLRIPTKILTTVKPGAALCAGFLNRRRGLLGAQNRDNFPTVSELAEEMHRSPRSIKYYLADLAAAGHIPQPEAAAARSGRRGGKAGGQKGGVAKAMRASASSES
jgi:hypothetical protein